MKVCWRLAIPVVLSVVSLHAAAPGEQQPFDGASARAVVANADVSCSVSGEAPVGVGQVRDGAAPMHWIVDGIPVSVASDDQSAPSIAMVDSNTAVVAWIDYRYPRWISAAKIDVGGNSVWEAQVYRNIYELPTFWNPIALHVVPDGTGGAYVVFEVNTWAAPSVDNLLYAQRLTPAGGLDCPSGMDWESVGSGFRGSRVVPGGDGTALMAMSVVDGMIYCCRRYPAEPPVPGEPWGSPPLKIGVLVARSDTSTVPSLLTCPDLIAADGGGAVVVWTDGEGAFEANGDVYAQKAIILPDQRATLWAQGGIPICNAPGLQGCAHIVTDGADGAIITWEDMRDGRVDIYAQRVNSSGECLWNANGVPVCTLTGLQGMSGETHRVASDGLGGAIVVWEDHRAGTADIYAQRMDFSGTPSWQLNGKAICSAEGNQTACKLVASELGRVIVCWQDDRYGNADVYAQKVDFTGYCYWPHDGVPISTASGSQTVPNIAGDGSGGAMIVWQDGRNGNADVFMQRVHEDIAPVATLLQSFSAVVDGPAITVMWGLSQAGEDMRFSVFRCVNSPGTFDEVRDAVVVREGFGFRYRDAHVSPGSRYSYRVDVFDEVGRRTLFETQMLSLPPLFLTLFQNHPNPFNPATTISYYLPDASRVTLDIYDSAGKRIARLADREMQSEGMHTIGWNGHDCFGKALTSGVYFCRLAVGKQMISKKMVLLR